MASVIDGVGGGVAAAGGTRRDEGARAQGGGPEWIDVLTGVLSANDARAGTSARLVRSVIRPDEDVTPGEAAQDERERREGEARAAERQPGAAAQQARDDQAQAEHEGEAVTEGQNAEPALTSAGAARRARGLRSGPLASAPGSGSPKSETSAATSDGVATRGDVQQVAGDGRVNAAANPARTRGAGAASTGQEPRTVTVATAAPAATANAGAGSATRRSEASTALGGARAAGGASGRGHEVLARLASIGSVGRGRGVGQESGKTPGETGHPRVLAEDAEGVVKQVTRGLADIVKRGGGEVTLRLRPHELGQVRVHLEVRDGVVTGRVEAANASARELLGERLDELRTALESRGLEVHRLSVVREPSEGGGLPEQARDGAGSESRNQESPGTGEGSGDARADGSARDGAFGSGDHAERGPWGRSGRDAAGPGDGAGPEDAGLWTGLEPPGHEADVGHDAGSVGVITLNVVA